MPSLTETLAGMGIDVAAQPGVTIDTERRPKKSPRAFCAPVRVPDEVYLVIAPVGGREDFAALFHEAGHTEHYAHVDRLAAGGGPLPGRQLGDRGVRVPVRAPGVRPRVAAAAARDRGPGGRSSSHERAAELVFLRRYAAKLAYELELHGGGPVDGLDAVYARRLSDAVHVDWPAVSWLTDVDPFFYAARYLRAWALETHLRAALASASARRGSTSPARAAFLRELWSAGQGAGGGEGILARVGRHELDFGAACRGLTAAAAQALAELLLHRAEHRLAVGVAALVVAHLAQLGRAQVAQPALHLRHRQVVVARDREARPDARARGGRGRPEPAPGRPASRPPCAPGRWRPRPACAPGARPRCLACALPVRPSISSRPRPSSCSRSPITSLVCLRPRSSRSRSPAPGRRRRSPGRADRRPAPRPRSARA